MGPTIKGNLCRGMHFIYKHREIKLLATLAHLSVLMFFYIRIARYYLSRVRISSSHFYTKPLYGPITKNENTPEFRYNKTYQIYQTLRHPIKALNHFLNLVCSTSTTEITHLSESIRGILPVLSIASWLLIPCFPF